MDFASGRSLLLVGVFSLVVSGLLQAEARGAEPVDLELVLAVDASSSVSAEEFDLQMRGLAEAFRHPAVAGAIQASGDLGVAVSLVQWADNRRQFLSIGWHLLQDSSSAVRFADVIDQTARSMVGGGTAIGGAIKYGLRQLEINGYEGRRKVIDVSGDGRTNQGARAADVRDIAVSAGVTINGLAILNEDPYIDRYYLYHVIGGTGAFVMTATDYQDFFKAMLEKLIKEISGVPLVLDQDPAGSGITVQEALLEEKLPSSIDLQ